MSKTPDEMSELSRKMAESAAELTRLSMEQGEQMLKLQVDTMRSMLNDNMQAAKALLEARDPQQWGTLQEQNMRDMVVRLTDYTRSVQELTGRSQKEISGLVGGRLHAMNEQCRELVDAMAKSAPAESAPVFSAIKQSLSAADGLMDSMSKTAQQMAKSTESVIKEATDAAVKAGKGRKGGGG